MELTFRPSCCELCCCRAISQCSSEEEPNKTVETPRRGRLRRGSTRSLERVRLQQRFGRRPPALASGAGMAACAAALGLWLLLAGPSAPADPAAPAAWLPVTALVLYIATSTVGFLTLPWAMLGELLPASARGLAGGLTTCMAYVFSFAMLKLYPSMLGALGAAGLFFLYGAAALAGTIFVAACLPETRGRSLLEIEALFAGRPAPAPAPGPAPDDPLRPRANGDAAADALKAAEAGVAPDDVELQPLARAS